MARTRETIGEVVLKGAKNADGKLVTQRDQDLLVKECYGTSVPSATTGYAMGCTFFNTSTGHIYVNTGSITSCTFNDVGSISSSEIDANAITPIKMGTRTLVALADSAATPTIAQLMTSSIFTMTPAAARTFTTPTATLMVAGITGATIGSWFDFTIVNLSASTANYGVTLTAGADVTLVGNAAVYSGAGSFRAVVTAVTVPTISIYRLDDAVSTVLSGVTAGTAAVSKALVLGASGEIATITSATITTLTAPTVNATNIDAGASAVPGTVDIFPTTASKGKLTISCTDNTDNFGTVLTNAANSTSTKTATIPALTGYVGLSTAALSLAEMDVLDAVTPGTGAASKAVVLDAFKTARVGDWVGSQAAGSAVVFAAGLDHYADGQLDILSVFGESTSDLTSAYSAKCGRFRHLVSCVADTVIAHETYGMIGQLSVKNGSLNHYHSGIIGTFETGTLCHIQTSYCAAAVMARPGGSGTTVESGGLLAGFAAVQNMSAITATGTYAAFATHKTAAGVAWPTGLYMQSGSVTTGIDLAGGFTTGVSITNAVLGVTDSRAIKVSTSQEAAAMADGYGVVEIDHTITGTAGSNFSGCALSSWVNIPTGTVGSGKYVCAQNNGIYEATAATITGARIIFGLRCQKLLDDTDATSFPFSINTNNTAITALIDVNNTTDLGWITAAASNGAGHIPLFRDNAGVVHYVNTYTS